MNVLYQNCESRDGFTILETNGSLAEDTADGSRKVWAWTKSSTAFNQLGFYTLATYDTPDEYRFYFDYKSNSNILGVQAYFYLKPSTPTTLNSPFYGIYQNANAWQAWDGTGGSGATATFSTDTWYRQCLRINGANLETYVLDIGAVSDTYDLSSFTQLGNVTGVNFSTANGVRFMGQFPNASIAYRMDEIYITSGDSEPDIDSGDEIDYGEHLLALGHL